MTEEKNENRGGAGRGQGRKKGSGSGRRAETRSISALPEWWQALDRARGTMSLSEWVRSDPRVSPPSSPAPETPGR